MHESRSSLLQRFARRRVRFVRPGASSYQVPACRPCWNFVATLVGLIVALSMPAYYTATAVIMPPQQQQSSASALLGQLGSLGSLGAASGIALKNPADLYVGILQSRVIADRLIDRFNLQAVYGEKYRAGARRVLSSRAEFEGQLCT